MKLRKYQKDAVIKICQNMKKVSSPNKLRVEISKGLGRSNIMTALVKKCLDEGDKVIVLSPNRSVCVRLKSLICDDENQGIYEIASYIDEYKDNEVLITTYNDVKNNREFSFEKFNVIICDGIHYLDSEMIEKGLENKKMCLIGFTSQVDGAVDGYFEDAKCVFRYTLQDALNAGYSVKGREFDAIVWEILKKQGYEMKMPEHLDAAYDMRADKGEKHFIIEVKTWFQETVSDSVLRKTVEQLLYAAQKENGVPMLVIAYPYPEEIKERLSTNEKIKIIGVIELLDMTQDDSELENRLRASLNYSLNKLQCKRQTTRLV